MSTKVNIPVSALGVEHINRPVAFTYIDHYSNTENRVEVAGVLKSVRKTIPVVVEAKPGLGVREVSSEAHATFDISIKGRGLFALKGDELITLYSN
jgi:hypothetical protein